jgi:HK97 family phage portal protein
MGFLSKFFERRANPMEDPKKPLGSSAIDAIFGWGFGGSVTAAGEVIDHHTALQHSTVFSCIRILAEAVGSLTLRLYDRDGKGRSESIADPLWKLLSIKPNDEMASSVLWENVIGCLALTGNSYIEIIRTAKGDVAQLLPLHPLKTQAVRLPNGNLAYKTWSGSNSQADAIILNASDVLHFRLFSMDGLTGLSPIHQARQTIGWSTAAIKQSARFFGNGSKPSSVLKASADVDDTDLSNFRKAWELANGGENQTRTAVIPNDWTYEAIGLSNSDSQFLESLQFSRSDIASIFRIPAHMVGDSSKLANNNVQSMNLSFLIDTLRPYLVKIEQEISIKLLGANPYRFVEFDTSERLRGDYATVTAGIATLRQWGVINGDEGREQLGMNPAPEGSGAEIYWAPVNMQDASRLLITESIQDQPVNANTDPVQAAAPKVDPEASRSLARFSTAFVGLYRDAVGRCIQRTNKDADTLSPILTPLFTSISETFEDEARTQFNLPAEWKPSEKIVRDLVKATSSKATTWTMEQRDQIVAGEMGKTLKTILHSIYREAGSAIAERDLNE